MRNIYLFRHGQPKVPTGERRYLSTTDLPLDETGVYQAERLAEWCKGKPVTALFSSPLRRCLQTAQAIGGGRMTPCVREELREMELGEWENLTFSQVRAEYPELYEKRGLHPGTVAAPGGESCVEAGERLLRCLDKLTGESEGDIAVVAHGGVNRGALCRLLKRSPEDVFSIAQPWGCVNVIRQEEPGRYAVVSVGEKPDLWPDEREQRQLWEKYATPWNVRAHCEAVGRKALTLADQLEGVAVNRELLQAACELHDLLRDKEGDHAAKAAAALVKEGYPATAEIIAAHHDLPADAGVEAQLLYLADKLLRGREELSLKERFAASRRSCHSPEGLANWRRRYDDALAIMKRYGLND